MGSDGKNFLLFKYFVFTRFSVYSDASWCAYLAALFFHADLTLTTRCVGTKITQLRPMHHCHVPSPVSFSIGYWKWNCAENCFNWPRQTLLQSSHLHRSLSVTKHSYLYIQLLNMHNFYIGIIQCSIYVHQDVALKPCEDWHSSKSGVANLQSTIRRCRAACGRLIWVMRTMPWTLTASSKPRSVTIKCDFRQLEVRPPQFHVSVGFPCLFAQIMK